MEDSDDSRSSAFDISGASSSSKRQKTSDSDGVAAIMEFTRVLSNFSVVVTNFMARSPHLMSPPPPPPPPPLPPPLPPVYYCLNDAIKQFVESDKISKDSGDTMWLSDEDGANFVTMLVNKPVLVMPYLILVRSAHPTLVMAWVKKTLGLSDKESSGS
jgi:hypothetical protein